MLLLAALLALAVVLGGVFVAKWLFIFLIVAVILALVGGFSGGPWYRRW